jgi:L-threonylcarbamoyladenylate synthase
LVDIILDGGDCTIGVESTVLSLLSAPPHILRPGGITPREIERIIGRVEIHDAVYREMAAGETAASPGMKHRHYAPDAEVALVSGELSAFIAFLKSVADPYTWALVFDGDLAAAEDWTFPALSYGPESSPEAQANRLFAVLRELDGKGAQQIYIRAPKQEGIGLAVYNRLLRAAEFRLFNA